MSKRRLRVNAYVLLADPSYLRESIAAYYPYVDRIVVSYDEAAVSWTGTPLPIEQCLKIIGDLDVDHKCELHPGNFGREGLAAFDNETHQRQVALDAASAGADWVLQLDTDEVMLQSELFFDMLDRADRAGAAAMDYPSRWLYTRTREGWYLEVSRRLWQVAASYPGPLAVRAGTTLRHARQTDVAHFRVDFEPKSTDPWRSMDALVHAVVPPASAVLHFSWVRDPELLRRKFAWSGHAPAMKPPKVFLRWVWRTKHPIITATTTPLRRKDDGRYRLVRIAEPPGGEPIRVDLPDLNPGHGND